MESAFDTISHFEMLKGAGINPQHAQAMTGATHYALSQAMPSSKFATKEELKTLHEILHFSMLRTTIFFAAIQCLGTIAYALVCHMS